MLFEAVRDQKAQEEAGRHSPRLRRAFLTVGLCRWDRPTVNSSTNELTASTGYYD